MPHATPLLPPARDFVEHDPAAAAAPLRGVPAKDSEIVTAGLDPAPSSNVILTTVTDVVGFFAFSGFAVLFEGYLL